MLTDYELGMFSVWARYEFSREMKEKLTRELPSVAAKLFGNVDEALMLRLVPLMRAGKKLEAIKLVREVKGLDLYAAKNFVEENVKTI